MSNSPVTRIASLSQSDGQELVHNFIATDFACIHITIGDCSIDINTHLVHYSTRDLYRRLGLLKQEVTIFFTHLNDLNTEKIPAQRYCIILKNIMLVTFHYAANML